MHVYIKILKFQFWHFVITPCISLKKKKKKKKKSLMIICMHWHLGLDSNIYKDIIHSNGLAEGHMTHCFVHFKLKPNENKF